MRQGYLASVATTPRTGARPTGRGGKNAAASPGARRRGHVFSPHASPVTFSFQKPILRRCVGGERLASSGRCKLAVAEWMMQGGEFPSTFLDIKITFFAYHPNKQTSKHINHNNETRWRMLRGPSRLVGEQYVLIGVQADCTKEESFHCC